MTDTRIFRMTRADGTHELGFRKNLAARLAANHSWRHGEIVAVEATNHAVTHGWADVTHEFLPAVPLD